ncbi:CHAT domain-containing tetratricopeptide repeat protein [Streptomyces sp. NPDC046994]|uniref:CHAT domain-containing tetratricopeptide repeat protein n=1 Tax=Streptomyces sp. NPDC046994 TaxID=3155735 RepID=UPI003456AA79
MSEKRYARWVRAIRRNSAASDRGHTEHAPLDGPERYLAEALMAAESVPHADGLLTRAAGQCDPDVLLHELACVRDELAAGGRHSEAALADFHRDTVKRQRPFLQRALALRGRVDAPGGRDWPLGFPEPVAVPRQLMEREASELMGRGELDAALATLRRAEEIPPHEPEEVVAFAGLRMHLAGELRSAGRSGEALALLGTVELGPDAGGALAGEALTEQLRSRFHRLRGLLCDDNGAYEDAQHSFQQAMDAARSCGDLEAQYQAHTDLAASYLKAGRAREGLREFRRVLAFVEARGGHTVGVLNNLGTAYRDVGEIEAALGCYQQARALLEQEGGEGLSMINALLGIGDIAAADGKKEEAAEAYFQALLKSVSSVRGVFAQGMPLVVSRFARMGEEGDLLLPVVELFREALGGVLESWQGQAYFRMAYANRDLRAGRYAEAVADLRALDDLAERQSSDVQLRLTVTQRLDAALTSWAEQRPEARQEAFDLLWAARSRLLSTLRRGRGQDRPAMVALHRDVYERLIELLVDYGPTLATPAGQPAVELAFDLHEEYKTWTGGTGRESAAPAGFHALRDWLGAHPDADVCAFLSYFCGRRAVTVFVHIPGTGRLTAVRTPLTLDTLRRAAERLRRTFDGDPDVFPPQGPLPAQRPWRRDLGFFEELATALLAGLPHVSDRELLCVAADGPVHDLPLHALPLPGDGRPLAERHAVVQVISATTLLRLADLPPAQADPTVYVGAVAARDDPVPERLEHDKYLFTVAGRPVVGVAGTEATPDAVAAGLRDASVAHLAAHGWFDVAEPMDSGVFLAHDGRRPPRDPYAVDVRVRLDHLLTARRLAREGLRLDLLTLRACSTARRDAHSTGYLEGIVQALLLSGVRTVVATLWDVDDASSRRLFADFYRHYLGDGADSPGREPWRALWDAQRAMLRQPDRPSEAHPFHWAAPALFGLWRHT